MTRAEAAFILEVDVHASQSQIKAAWRRKMKQVHPDLHLFGGSREKFEQVQKAYLVLRSGVDAKGKNMWDGFDFMGGQH